MISHEQVFRHPTQASEVRLTVFERAADTSPVEGLPDEAGFLVTETWRGTSKVVKTLGFFATRADADACVRRRGDALTRQLFRPQSPQSPAA
jgi:hypothetical protein